jgi:hypothetical protein
MEVKDLIKEKLVEIHKTCTTDGYGQMGKYNLGINSLFGKDAQMVEEFVKENKSVILISTYGGSVGTYRAITEIIDPEIKRLCREAFSTNENHLRNLNSW